MPAEARFASWSARVSCRLQLPPHAGLFPPKLTQRGIFRSCRHHSSVPAPTHLQTFLKARCPAAAEREKRKRSAGTAEYRGSRKRKMCSVRREVELWKGA